MRKKQFELLAPAGSYETFQAVIEAGADAVYVGGNRFGARAYADNFSNDELLKALDYAHLRQKQVYLTVNTLFKNTEIQELYDYLLPFYEHGLDAVIVQDFGALSFIHQRFPELPLHTSTQMTITGSRGADLLKNYGVSRVVMAREMAIPEMEAIKRDTGLELEAFIHGALCYSYSGQCLFSSVLGGRSGNRGRCAQPCRLPYQISEQKSYLLSMKDMCGISSLPELAKAGVYSLKIEGRMKQAEYAAGVVSIYRKYIDLFEENPQKFVVAKKDRQKLLDLGNRCGFTDLYYTKHNDSSMITYEKPNYTTANENLHKQIEKNYLQKHRKLKITGSLFMQIGEPAVLAVNYGDFHAAAIGPEVSAAKSKPLSKTDLDSRIRKTGETPFEFEALSITMGEEIFMPNGAVNQLRREALEQLQQAICGTCARNGEVMPKEIMESNSVENCSMEHKRTSAVGIRSCSIENRTLLETVLSFSSITAVYIDWNTYKRAQLFELLCEDTEKIHLAGKEVYLILPAISRKYTMEFLEEHIEQLRVAAVDGFVVRTYEELSFVREYFPDLPVVTDHNLYTYNDAAKNEFFKLGIERDSVPLELNHRELTGRDNQRSEMIIYGAYPLLTSAQCIHKNTLACDHTPVTTWITDRYNKQFPVKNYCSECYNVIYNSVPTMLFSYLDELEACGIQNYRIAFTTEEKEQATAVLKAFESRQPLGKAFEYTNGHYKRGVE